MNIDYLYEKGIVGLTKQEQGLAWLIENGPLVSEPALPRWMIESLVNNQRILRLRRGLYLVPTTQGELPSLGKTITLLNPEGYITGQAALSLYGLNDQDIIDWQVVSPVYQADFSYGLFGVHFIFSPVQAANGERIYLDCGQDKVLVASVGQAFIDEVRFAGRNLNWLETARTLKNALRSYKTDENKIETLLLTSPSTMIARKIGFLLNVLQGVPNEGLLALSREDHNTTLDSSGEFFDHTWRLKLPFSPQEIKRGIHES